MIRGNLALRDFPFQVLCDSRDSAIQEAVLDIVEKNFEARSRSDVCDTVAHRAGANYANRFDNAHLYRSTARATALPPPRHRVAMPRLPFLRAIS